MKRNKKHENRVRKMVVACSLSAIVLTASTYAWFIGMKTVNVAPFEVNIAAIDGLALSLNGETWQDTVSINATNYDDTGVVGEGHHNVWDKLIPMSSVGVINTTSSNLELYEKGSLTPTDGGYRLLASEVDNRTAFGKETRGYVAFDLFVKNLSGNAYYPAVEEKNEEAIYLTTDSHVKVSDAGANADKTGIENSVRIAFAQIGRIEADVPTATGLNARAIECKNAKAGSDQGGAPALSICDRKATIWEPNDTKHVKNAINWYNQSCKKRTGDAAYSGSCETITNDVAYPTYAINKKIKNNYKVDVYDGAAYNSYAANVGESNFLKELKSGVDNYFTDSDKIKEGTARPKFMNLAPKSVTKVRIYIYLEGQDVDNYDFASLGKKIEVKFGFTKERFTGEDIEYDGPQLPVDVLKAGLTHNYQGSAAITNISDGVTHDGSKFIIPKGVFEFTFMEGEQPKKATAVVKNLDEGNKLSPSYVTDWTIE